jgi:hypothetical protein
MHPLEICNFSITKSIDIEMFEKPDKEFKTLILKND